MLPLLNKDSTTTTTTAAAAAAAATATATTECDTCSNNIHFLRLFCIMQNRS